MNPMLDLLPLYSAWKGLGRLLKLLEFRSHNEWSYSMGSIDMNDSVELLAQSGVKVMAVPLGMRVVHDPNRSLKTGPSQHDRQGTVPS
jgi:hypothetical protein